MSHSYAPWSNPPYRYPSMFVSSLLLFCLLLTLLLAACPFPESSLGIPSPASAAFFHFFTVGAFCHTFSRHNGDTPTPACKKQTAFIALAIASANDMPSPGSAPAHAGRRRQRPSGGVATSNGGGGGVVTSNGASPPAAAPGPKSPTCSPSLSGSLAGTWPSARRRRCRCRPMLKDGTTTPSSSSVAAAQQQEPPRRRL